MIAVVCPIKAIDCIILYDMNVKRNGVCSMYMYIIMAL